MNFELYDEQEFKEYLETLPIKSRMRLLALIQAIEDAGMVESMKRSWDSKIQKNLYEIRLETNGLYPRALFFKVIESQDTSNNEPRYVITNAFSKKTNKTPVAEINKSLNRRTRYYKWLETNS